MFRLCGALVTRDYTQYLSVTRGSIRERNNRLAVIGNDNLSPVVFSFNIQRLKTSIIWSLFVFVSVLIWKNCVLESDLSATRKQIFLQDYQR